MKNFLRSSGLLCSLCLFLFSAKAQNGVYYIPLEREFDSVKNVLPTLRNDTLKMSAYFLMAAYYTELDKDSSLYYAELQKEYAEKLHQKIWEANACFQIAYIAYGLGNYPKSLTAVTDGFVLTNDPASEKNNWWPERFSGDGNSRRARLFIASALHQVFAFLYENVGDQAKAKSEYLEAIRLAESVDNQEELSLDYMSLGGIYLDHGKSDSALIIENKAKSYALQSGYKIYLGFILNQIGRIYFERENYDSAGRYFSHAIVASIEQFNLKDELDAYILMARLKIKIGQLDSSLYYSQTALRAAQKFGLASGTNRAYNAIYQVYNAKGHADSAFYYLKKAKSLGDSLSAAERTRINQYQRMNLDEEIRLRETENANIRRINRNRTYVMISGIGVLILIAFILYSSNRNRKKANDLLQKKNEQIEDQKVEIENTLTELRSTQAHLIQSEKMASLGELTAGIAHEIQNPLNFVNNFSEVSAELVDELNEAVGRGLPSGQAGQDATANNNITDAVNGGQQTAGNGALVSQLLSEIKQNLSKINQHGKRADAIVKGMLQHSQARSGTRELTDINTLVDEYVRLARQSYKAKDNSIDVKIDTDYDQSIGKINIVPQDIGKVLLNVLNNSLYAVSERSRKSQAGDKNQNRLGEFHPEISVSTKSGNRIEISITDNGGGIPEGIVSKIFQPFYTTKPTGQGTGLGLSLAYDIVKAHGGEIKINNNPGERLEFVISLPGN